MYVELLNIEISDVVNAVSPPVGVVAHVPVCRSISASSCLRAINHGRVCHVLAFLIPIPDCTSKSAALLKSLSLIAAKTGFIAANHQTHGHTLYSSDVSAAFCVSFRGTVTSDLYLEYFWSICFLISASASA